jgi:uridine phosphorylase
MKITFKTKDNKTYHLGIDKINPNIISAGSKSRIKRLATYLEKAKTIEADRGLLVVNGTYKGLEISGVTTGMGPASTAIVLPEIFELAKDELNILRLGTSGALQEDIKLGNIVISLGAVRDERTTQAVIGLEYPAIASFELIPFMIGVGEKHGYKLNENLWLGITHIKDDLYFIETPQFSPRKAELRARLNSFKEMGVMASEMEFSVYCILKDYYRFASQTHVKIRVGCLLAIISKPKPEEVIDVSSIDKQRVEEDIIKIGLDTLVEIGRFKKGKSKLDLEKIFLKLL